MGKISPGELASREQTDCCRARTEAEITLSPLSSAADENGNEEGSSSPEVSSSSETDEDEDSDTDAPQRTKRQDKSRPKVSCSWSDWPFLGDGPLTWTVI